MKVIFLDCDGVLNWAGTEDRINGFVGMCPERIARFNKIIEAVPEAKIVISSSWRLSGLFGAYEDIPGLIRFWQSRGVKGEFIGITPIHFGSRARGDEIREWIEDYETDNEPLESFVILDDDTSGMGGFEREKYVGLVDGEGVYETVYGRDLRPNHVITDWTGDLNFDGEEGGLQDRHIEQAIKILKGNK